MSWFANKDSKSYYQEWTPYVETFLFKKKKTWHMLELFVFSNLSQKETSVKRISIKNDIYLIRLFTDIKDRELILKVASKPSLKNYSKKLNKREEDREVD